MAWNSRSRASTAVPPALFPSTMKSSHWAGSLIEQSASLPGRAVVSRADLRRVRSRALRAACRAFAASTALLTIARASVGCSSRNCAQGGVDRALDEPAHRRVAEARLRLALELRLAQLHRDDGREPLEDVVAEQAVVLLLQGAAGARVDVQGARESGLESGEVRAALVRVDVVGEGEDLGLVARVPLHRDLDVAVGGDVVDADDVLVDGAERRVDVPHEVGDAALVVEALRPRLAALVDERQAEAGREEGHLAHALGQRLELEVAVLEHVEVGKEHDGRARLVRRRRRARARWWARRARTTASRRAPGA